MLLLFLKKFILLFWVYFYRPRSLTPPSEYPQAGRSDISQESVDQSTWERQQKHWLSDMKSRGVKIVQVTYPRTANNDKELTVVRGEYLEVSWFYCF